MSASKVPPSMVTRVVVAPIYPLNKRSVWGSDNNGYVCTCSAHAQP